MKYFRFWMLIILAIYLFVVACFQTELTTPLQVDMSHAVVTYSKSIP